MPRTHHSVSARHLFYFSILAILLACRINAPTSVSADATRLQIQKNAASDWSLSFQLSGGFAGFDRELQLSSSGELTARDRTRSIDVTGKAPAKELAQISALMADLKSVDSGRAGPCRDCLEYHIEIRVRDETTVIHLNDVTKSKSAAEPLLTALTTLMDRALTGRL